ncbi:thymidylate kinase [Candidatus Woesearchaeota archaeon]|nr:thymidylate kinase [Candidatus Woesearchaeota archaeon]
MTLPTEIKSSWEQKQNGTYVVFDGLSGCGKDTAIMGFASYLHREKQAKRGLLLVQEPYGYITFRAKLKAIREDTTDTDLESRARREVDVFYQDRWQHMNEVIYPALSRGNVVLQNRGKYATVANQGARGYGPQKIARLHGEEPNSTPLAKADLVFILQISPETAYERLLRSGRTLSDSERDLDLQRKIADLYARMPEFFPDERIVFLNAEQPADHVVNGTQLAWQDFLKTKA